MEAETFFFFEFFQKSSIFGLEIRLKYEGKIWKLFECMIRLSLMTKIR